MVKSQDKTVAVIFRVPAKVKKELEEQAQKESRSLANYTARLVIRALKEERKESA